MTFPPDVIELENRSLGRHGSPTLASAYERLKQYWDAGNHDREVALHLLFLAWYGLCEPAHITGFETEGMSRDCLQAQFDQLQDTFNQIHTAMEPQIDGDPEMLYVVGLMAHLFPYLLGDELAWTQRSEHYRRRYHTLLPMGISPSVFHHRGAYGDYFAHQARGNDGY
jgi:hypothetical protein